MRGGVEVGLTGTQSDNVLTLSLEFLGTGRNGESCRGFDTLYAVRKVRVQAEGSLG
jgi:hypothetical protein